MSRLGAGPVGLAAGLFAGVRTFARYDAMHQEAVLGARSPVVLPVFGLAVLLGLAAFAARESIAAPAGPAFGPGPPESPAAHASNPIEDGRSALEQDGSFLLLCTGPTSLM